MALIPCAKFYEPSYETGKAVRWRIGMPDGGPLAIAGLWRQSTGPDGAKSLAMTMLTVNADEHPLVKRFDRPGAEKRSVVILPRSQYADWLSCSTKKRVLSYGCARPN